MKKERSYIELAALPLEHLTEGVSLSSILQNTKYAPISEEQKQEVVILKEAFVLLDRKRRRTGVFTRSDKDHGSKIGECSTLLCGNFDKTECTLTRDGTIVYDVKDRLHNYMREISGLFVESRNKQIPTVYLDDRERKKRYLFLLFELTCDSKEMPLCYRLDNRAEDMFIGMRDITDVVRGIHKYNRTLFQVDKALVDILSQKRRRLALTGKFSMADKLIDTKLVDVTLVKFNLIGI